MVGHAYNTLKEAYFGLQAARLMLLQYETLVTDPGKALTALYRFIGEPPFAHDVERAEFDTSAYDQRAGTPGLHTVRPRVDAVATKRETILPPDLFKRVENEDFWRNPNLNPRQVLIV